MRLYNLGLLDAYGSVGKPVVFARIKSGQKAGLSQLMPNLYVPLVA